jgi:Rrf2 family protein
MLKLTKRSDYGLIALLHLCGDRAATAKEMAEQYRIPLALLSKVLQSLSKNGFLISEQGTKGGYRLARDPHAISALEVVRAIDGPVILASCFHEEEGCDQFECCTVKTPLRKVHDEILRVLDSISISDMNTGRDNIGQNQVLWKIGQAPSPKPLSIPTEG